MCVSVCVHTFYLLCVCVCVCVCDVSELKYVNMYKGFN